MTIEELWLEMEAEPCANVAWLTRVARPQTGHPLLVAVEQTPRACLTPTIILPTPGRQDGGLRPVLRLDGQAGDERAAMVCDHFARSARHPHLHAGQAAASRQCHAPWSSPAGDGNGNWLCPSSQYPTLESAARLYAALWPSRRRQFCPADTSPPASSPNQTKI